MFDEEAAKAAALASMPAFAGAIGSRAEPTPRPSLAGQPAARGRLSDNEDGADAARKQQRAQRFKVASQRPVVQAASRARERTPDKAQPDVRMGQHPLAPAMAASAAPHQLVGQVCICVRVPCPARKDCHTFCAC